MKASTARALPQHSDRTPKRLQPYSHGTPIGVYCSTRVRPASKAMLKETRVTVKIPRPLYRRIQQVIENTGFSSPTDFIVFVLRDLMGEVEANGTEEFSPDELKAIKQKLRNLGYLD
jgi:Arc/MetJ-type ribon-helix-helix transcriptional regulator